MDRFLFTLTQFSRQICSLGMTAQAHCSPNLLSVSVSKMSNHFLSRLYSIIAERSFIIWCHRILQWTFSILAGCFYSIFLHHRRYLQDLWIYFIFLNFICFCYWWRLFCSCLYYIFLYVWRLVDSQDFSLFFSFISLILFSYNYFNKKEDIFTS